VAAATQLLEQIDDRTGGAKRTYYRPLTRPTGRRFRGHQEESSGLREHPRSRARFGHERPECDQAARDLPSVEIGQVESSAADASDAVSCSLSESVVSSFIVPPTIE
jgi:hypothetical protein